MCHAAPLLLRYTLAAPLILVLGLGCSRAEHAPPSHGAPAEAPAVQGAPSPAAGGAKAPSLSATEQSSASRKIIRSAHLRVEADDPSDVQRQAAEIAEQLGGFVVTSESRRSSASTEESPSVEVELVLRVPAERFTTAMERLRRVASRVLEEKVGGQDVTEEYIDLEAGLHAKRALEAQFLEILKGAKTVKDALDVQEHLGGVRAEIEKLEGRRRFLENQTALSTITMNVDRTEALVRASGFGFRRAFQQAGADLVNVSAGLLIGGVRLGAWLVPFLVLVGLPAFCAVRLIRRWRRRATAA